MFESRLNPGDLMFERILVAIDGSKNSERAAKAGVELAKLSGGKVTAIYVTDVGKHIPTKSLCTPFGGLSPDAIAYAATTIRDELLEAGEMATRQVEEVAKDSGVLSERLIVEGNPASEILRIAEEAKMNVIVMGGIGKTGLEKFLLGSVAERVVRNSKVPVLIAR